MDMVLEEFDAARLTREEADTVRPLVAVNRNKLTLQIAQDPAPMYSDRLKLRQVLLNLLGNAAKFTEDGEIVLSLGQRRAADIICLAFTVRDTGRGIAEVGARHPVRALHAGRPRAGPPAPASASPSPAASVASWAARSRVISTPGAGSIFTVTVPAATPACARRARGDARKPHSMDRTGDSRGSAACSSRSRRSSIRRPAGPPPPSTVTVPVSYRGVREERLVAPAQGPRCGWTRRPASSRSTAPAIRRDRVDAPRFQPPRLACAGAHLGPCSSDCRTSRRSSHIQRDIARSRAARPTRLSPAAGADQS